MLLFQISILFLLFGSSLVCTYYWFLLLSALFFNKKKADICPELPAGQARLAIVIPAHNEEEVLHRTLHSCRKLEYPADRYEIFVVADNCSDATARVAADYGVVVLERQDEFHKGKGYALAHAFDHILPQGYEAVLVVDADCLIDEQALAVIDARLGQGHQVLQMNYMVENPDQSVMSYALAVGNFIENAFLYAPKSHLGLSIFLRGTGMVIHRDVLLAHPWAAHSIVEDVEYSLTLLQAGQRISFVPEVKVASPFPVEPLQLRVQRSRWATGNLSFGRKSALKLMGSGLRQRKWIMVDAGWTFMILSRPLVLLQLFATFSATAALYVLAPGTFATLSLGTATTLLALFFIYFLTGIVQMGLSKKRLFFLARVPLTVMQLIVISLRGVWGGKSAAWVRTPR